MYSDFWLDYAAGRRRLSAAWVDRDVAELAKAEPPELADAESLDMGQWMRIPDRQQRAIAVMYVTHGRRLRQFTEIM